MDKKQYDTSRLLAILEGRNITKSALQRAIGEPRRSNVNMIVNGTRHGERVRKKICTFLGVNYGDVFNE